MQGLPVPDLSEIARENLIYVESLYEDYRRDPESVDADWALLFAGLEGTSRNGHRETRIDQRGHLLRQGNYRSDSDSKKGFRPERNIGVFDLIHSFRQFGHLVANLDPLGNNDSFHPLLDPQEFGFGQRDLERVVESPTYRGADQLKLSELIRLLRSTYCGTIGVEYMDIIDKDQRDWLQEHMEPCLNRPPLSNQERKHVFDTLSAAEKFEQFLHTKYVGQKRFSLEGGESLIPMLDALIEDAGSLGVDEIVMGMAHRGRLNVLAHILGKPYEMIFAEFEGAFLPANIQGDGDVKYHLGYSNNHTTRSGAQLHLSLGANPSHLEAINPVVEGMVRAKQNHLGDLDRRRVVPLLIHGDASFSGQGLVSETLSLSELKDFRTGGTIHIIINNQIGFTTSPEDYRFTRYPTDIAKEIQAPVFHVNGDDPEAAVHAAKLAIDFRQKFKVDVIIDLVCYRRHGHNEADDPSFTQPRLYNEIKKHPTVLTVYSKRLIEEQAVSEEEIAERESELKELYNAALDYARDFMPRQQVFTLGGTWKGMEWAGSDWSAETKVPMSRLKEVLDGVRSLPQGFTAYPKAKRILDQRSQMLDPSGQIDWGCAEMLAFGSLLLEGTHVRLSGQDSGRGTFGHRHSILYDTSSGEPYVPLDNISAEQGRLRIVNSMLSEAAVLGFEYGFSLADPNNLVLWEAQFGDFANGAQVIIDQFISSAESKWQRMSGLVMLLPHGYEGQGPEHSSARLERYMQLCAGSNWQVCNLTTPAQYFHALRRQIHRPFRKPLILMSPKSLLRHRLATSSAADLCEGTFQPVIAEKDPLDVANVKRLIFCSGKVYYDLIVDRLERDIDDIAIVRVEQLYPFPANEIEAIVATYPNLQDVMWVQEEPWNMGAWHDMSRRLRRVVPEHLFIGYAGRRAASSPASGSYKVHQEESAALIDTALRRSHGN